ncbi:hypothetical protein KGB53_gp61 [Klebsiella virus KpV2811]|uniref:hypothetical protein n=1 Tax=Klebsiella virus KpV2811 TaxID=2759464 RepID=UPI00176D9EE5|nr:hypothetical protein KGB53_gp61 [Klebsiella virus KpV2811]QMP82027.1 hypothetical protein KpV2811_061 [Klebsiella virus KpV2811]
MIYLVFLYVFIGCVIDFPGIYMSVKDLIKSIDGLYRALLVFIIMLLSSLAWPYLLLKAATRKR